MASAQEVEMLRRQLDELTARMEEVRQQSSSTAMNAAATGLTEAVRPMGQSKSRPEDMRVGKPEPYAPGKDFDVWGLHFQRIRVYARSCLNQTLLKAARLSPTVVMVTPPHERQFCGLDVPSHDAHNTERSTESREESWKQLFRSLQTAVPDVRNVRSGRQHWTCSCQIMTYKFGSMIEDVEDRLNEFLELVRRYDDSNGADPVPDQVKKACTISKTPEPLKTHLQLNVAKLGIFNALRVATEDYLRSRRIFRTTSVGNIHDEDPMEVDVISRKGKGKGKSSKGKKGGKKGKESHSGKGYGETTAEHSRFEGECRNC